MTASVYMVVDLTEFMGELKISGETNWNALKVVN